METYKSCEVPMRTIEEAERRFQIAATYFEDYHNRSEAAFGKMFINGEKYAEHAFRPNHWVVEGLIPGGYLAVLGATSKAGKTCFATALAMSIATGDPFLGMRVYPGAVLWCAYEENEAERLQVLKKWPEHPFRFYITHEKPLIDTQEGLDAISYWMNITNAKLVVIDPLYGATEAESLADGRAARRVLAGLKELCRKHRCAALVLHHITKDVSAGLVRERFADSNQILATASMDMLMDCTELAEGERLYRISCRGRGTFANRTLCVRSSGITDYQLIEDPDRTFEGPNLTDTRLVNYIEQSPTPLTASDLARDLRLKIGTVRNHLTGLVRDGRILALGKIGHRNVYAPVGSSSE